MIYQAATHSKIKVGQLWRCIPPEQGTVLIVAIDSCPSGLVINVLLEDGLQTDQISCVLAPIAWPQLEPHLTTLLQADLDVSEHLADYGEWKALAEDGQAGYFNCDPASVLSTIRSNVN